MRRSVFLLGLIASPLLAQQQQSAPANLGVSSSRMLFDVAHTYVLRSAEQMPESLYSFRPTPEVRSFGQLIGHVADAERMFCAMVTGEKPAGESAEKTQTAKAALVAALKASGEYCARAYAITDADAAAPLNIFGQPRTKMFALTMNATHDWEHYGNLVTYLRLKGQVPPSSQQ